MNIMAVGTIRKTPNHTLSMAGKNRVTIRQRGYPIKAYTLSELIAEAATASPDRYEVLLRALAFLRAR